MPVSNTRLTAATPKPLARVFDWRARMFPLAVFLSASLVFLVEPMVGKLLLPLLGGAPAVWNTSLAFFQVALLAGYAYAHGLQRIASFRIQVLIHGAVLALAALTLPLHISRILGDPDPAHPILWILGTLTLSVGPAFAALSATAPLVQAWFARTSAPDPETGKPPEPYALYAASNLGSLLALIAYPVLVEPLLRLSTQRAGWSIGFAVFAAVMVCLGLIHRDARAPAEAAAPAQRPSIPKLAAWTLLAALPSSLMMGVTTYLSTDVATAPFLWVVPLTLYLLTFIVAFAARPVLRPSMVNVAQAIAVCACVYIMLPRETPIAVQLSVHLLSFFMTALVCHMALAAARPEPGQLTLFYLCMSVGGVVGGSFNAFVTPIIFPTVVEYPLVLVLACLARPWNGFKLSGRALAFLLAGVAAAAIVVAIAARPGAIIAWQTPIVVLFLGGLGCAFLLRDRAVWMVVVLAAMAFAGQCLSVSGRVLAVDRSFFGVSKVVASVDPRAGPIHEMVHGTTRHGAQETTPGRECTPMMYYTPQAPIGQALTSLQARKSGVDVGVVGLGAGTLASYVRPGDHMTYFEIDPTVIRLAGDPHYFTYLSHCARAPVAIRAGDARLTLAPLPQGRLDALFIDAFSSDAVPAHLLTVEAVRMYLSKVRPDGFVLFHVSNRHLELRDPVMAAIRQAGGVALEQTRIVDGPPSLIQSSSIVVVAARGEAGLAAFRKDRRWTARDPGNVAPWTDDYMNLIGAMLRRNDTGRMFGK
jgi:hypothetical protein